jgi:hypothetical protein
MKKTKKSKLMKVKYWIDTENFVGVDNCTYRLIPIDFSDYWFKAYESEIEVFE